MPQADGLVDPLVTGLLLYFTFAWFRVSRHFKGSVDLSDAINAVLEYPILLLLKSIPYYPMLLVLYAAWYAFAGAWFVIYPSSLPEWAADMGMIAYGYAGIFQWMIIFFDWAINALRLIPIEIAVVFATLAFLHIITSGAEYGTN